ncbi:ParB/RepB/Spo0J family partition protein [Streptomyces sp. NPDC088785]|uniref:ParB/RepB/Spo0J family partition protein n=1 Tax=Streptomyces sp. NPDC088785 TaxID=3365897 RepID=UPI00380BD754
MGTASWLPLTRCLANPQNPRDPGDVSDLASIKDRQLQSCRGISSSAYLKLWPEDVDRLEAAADSIVIINGNRRLTAAREYGRENLLVLVDDTIAASRAAVLRAAYDENTARQDFDPIEEAKAVMGIVSQYATAKEAAKAEGWSESWISHRKNLLKLHPELQQEVRARAKGSKEGDGISINVARRLGSVKGIQGMDLPSQRSALADLLQDDAQAAETAKKIRRQTKVARKARTQRPEHGRSTERFPGENSGPLADQQSGEPGSSAAAETEDDPLAEASLMLSELNGAWRRWGRAMAELQAAEAAAGDPLREEIARAVRRLATASEHDNRTVPDTFPAPVA